MMVGPLPGTVSSTGEVPGQIACAPLGRVGSNPTPGATYSTALLRPRLIRFQERRDSQILCVNLVWQPLLNRTQHNWGLLDSSLPTTKTCRGLFATRSIIHRWRGKNCERKRSGGGGQEPADFP